MEVKVKHARTALKFVHDNCDLRSVEAGTARRKYCEGAAALEVAATERAEAKR